MTELVPSAAITGCMLAGGEGRRMNGRDKGLLPYRGRPLGEWVLASLAMQCDTLAVSANRHLPEYAAMLAAHPPQRAFQGARVSAASTPTASAADARAGSYPQAVAEPSALVWADDPDLPLASGPLAGILTALRHCRTDWLLVAPCDVPHLPRYLAALLMAEAARSGADIVVPQTRGADGESRPHWVCALIHKRVCPHTEALFVTGERKVGSWMRAARWSSVSFPDEAAFTNMNNPETLHGRA